uniref:Peptidase M41 domain-containing protein n=1 Tax=Leptocylindrus danicus TaxID=163516 RepID=A0A7S2KN54_9STRA|mmetsp:Transcript_24037/g.36075  ORF Transcript_24037/g.36075 Transcript_24037/m.36075 type:complete len:393 (+) Transcript_24037:71-1249(+)
MKLNLSLFLLSIGAAPSSAFVHHGSLAGSSQRMVSLFAVNEDEIAALRAQAAKAREQANALAKELGKDISEPKKVAVIERKSLSASEIASLTGSVAFEGGDATAQVEKLDSLVSTGEFSMWKKATREQSNSSGMFRSLRPYPVSLNMLEQRSGDLLNGKSLGVDGEMDVNLNDFKDATIAVTLGSTVAAIASLAFLPENVGATVCYLFALIPVGFIAVGSSAPGAIAAAIVAAKGEADDKEAREDRICRHEAAHFLCGYMCGLPVKEYSITDNGFPCVEFHESSEGKIINREFSSEEIAALAVVAMSGSVAEAIKFSQARGGGNDLLQLENFFRRSADFIGAAKQQDLTRWGALASYQILRDYSSTFESLVEAFKVKKSVSECVAIVEGTEC